MSNPFYGVNVHLASRYGGHVAGPVALMQQSGARWVREEIRWDMVRDFSQSTDNPAGWNFDRAVEVVNAEVAAGLKILGLLGYNIQAMKNWMPDWQMPDLTQWTVYVDQMARRFKGLVSAWEVWNEPNAQPMFWRDTTDPQDDNQTPQRIDNYIQLLRATYATIKGIDSTATVVSAGCSNVNPNEWLEIFRDHGGMNCCDAVGVHPYIPRDSLTRGVFRTHDLTRLKAFQDSIGGKELWFTELGWSSAIARLDHSEDDACVGSEELQADFLEQQYTEILASGIQLGPVFWYDLHEDPVDPTDPNDDIASREHHFGLLRLNPHDRDDWTQTKPAYDRYKTLSATIGGGSMANEYRDVITGRLVANAMYEFFEANGQIPVLGRPLTDEFKGTWPDDPVGSPHRTMQIFERDVLGFFPENEGTARVQALRLGAKFAQNLGLHGPGIDR